MSTIAARIPRPSAGTWESVFGICYTAMMTNLLLAVGSLPLLVLLVTTDPRASWPALVLTGIAAVPALTAAFAVFRDFTLAGAGGVIRTFARAWLAHLRRSLAVGMLAGGVAVVLIVDVVTLTGSRAGAIATPVLVVLLALTLATALTALVATVERPDARLREVLKASLYLSLRRWYLTAASFAVLALLAWLLTTSPALAVGLAASPLLYAVWGNARFTLRPVLPVGSSITTR